MKDVVISSSVLILAILLIRRFTKGKINPLLRYMLWLIVVMRLVFPFPLWNSSVSVMNLFSQTNKYSLKEQAKQDAAIGKVADTEGAIALDFLMGKWEENWPEQIQSQIEQAQDQADTAQSLTNQQRQSELTKIKGKQPGQQSEIKKYLLAIWLMGVLVVGGYMLFYQFKWKKYLYKNRVLLKGMSKYRNILSVYTVEGLPSPCLSGRSIYLTERMAKEEEELTHILAHEYCHYRHLDFLWVIIRCVLVTAYWFHPLVWVAAYTSKQDSEFACDEAAIRLLGEKERFAYGRTLIKMISENSYDRSRMGIASTMSSGEKGIRERIGFIARKPKYLFIIACIVALFAIVLIAVTFSGAEQSADASIATVENEGQKENQDVSEQNAPEQLPKEGMREAEQDAYLQEKIEQLQREEGQLQETIEQLQKEREKIQEEAEQLKAVQKEAEDGAFMKKMDSFEDDFSTAKNLSDYVQKYYANGEEALEEGIYLLEREVLGDDALISIYGLYTKEYGCRGIKLLIGDDVNSYDLPWLVTSTHGMKENLRTYGLEESTGDGKPRTFACKMPLIDTSDTEVWELYIGDRYDTGKVELSPFNRDDYMAQIKEKLDFKIAESENKVYVFDNGKMIGAIEVPESEHITQKIEDVVFNGNAIGWELGYYEDEIRILTAIGLKLEGEEEIWYRGLNLLSFSVDCGNFGNRTFTLGEARIETEYINGMIQKID